MSTDLDKLQGTWTVTSFEIDAQELSSPALDGSFITIKKTAFKSAGMGSTYEGTIEIDDTKKPKIFDLLFKAGPEKGNRNLGIYKLDGDQWTICLATRGDKRPRKFATEPGSGIALETLKRGPASKSKTAPKSKPAVKKSTQLAEGEAASGAPTELEGDWAMISAVFNGAPLEKSMVTWCKRSTKGDITTVTAGTQVMLKASFTLDGSSSPKRIDYRNLAGVSKGKTQAGIYELPGDDLRICMAAPGSPRPTAFESKRGDGRSFTTWLRLSKK